MSYTYGVYNLQLIGPPAAVEWFGAACSVEVKGLNRDDMDRNNLVFKASEEVAKRFGGMNYDDLPERVCPLEFAAPVQVANEWRNPDGTQAYFVTVYDAGRAEGGPEEGGWWFDCGVPIEWYACRTGEEAEELADRLRSGEYAETGRRNSVLGGEDYDVRVGIEPGRAFPETTPHYE